MAASQSVVLRNDRWVQSRYAKLLEAASPDVRAEMDKAVAARLADAAKDAAPDGLRRALRFFGDHAAAEEARERLAQRLLSQRESRLEIELLLRGLERSSDRQRSAAAVARLAEFYRTAGDWPKQSHGFTAARQYYDLLKGDLASVAGADGKTGKQLFDEALAGDKNFSDFLQPKPWPTGKIKAETSSSGGTTSALPIRRLPGGWAGQPDLDTTLLTDPLASQYRYQIRAGKFVAANGSGRPLFEVPLAEADAAASGAVQTVGVGHRLAAHGHLLALVTGYEIIGIDASPGAADSNRLLWRHSLTKLGENDAGTGLAPSASLENMPWGQSVIRFNSPQGQLGSLQPVVSSRQVSFLRGTELVAVDALTGDVLWKRGGMTLGSDVIGDEENLLVIGAEDGKTSIYRALDGESLGTRTVPPRPQRMATFGCRVLCWTPDAGGDKVALKMVDILADKTLWSVPRRPSPGRTRSVCSTPAAQRPASVTPSN
jgi:hypothetical protein